MLILISFVVLAALAFGIVWFVTRPTKTESALEQRLTDISRPAAAGEDVILNAPDIVKRVTYSDIPIVDSILQASGVADHLYDQIKQANVNWTVGRLVFGSAFALIAVTWLAALWFHNAGIGLIIGLGAGVSPYIFLSVKRSQRLNRFSQLLPEGIDLMSRALRAGHALTATIEMVAREIPDPVGTEFRRCFEEQNYGLPLREALINLAKRVPVADLKFLVTAMLVQKETGGNLAEVLDKTAMVIRERARLLGQLRIYTAQGRMTGWILGVLPFVMFVLLHFLNPGYTKLLLETPTGLKLVWTGIALMCLGVWVIRRIVDIKV
ncbi:MAG TPA: type II secretion system F family protein [Terriglobales bacterium]